MTATTIRGAVHDAAGKALDRALKRHALASRSPADAAEIARRARATHEAVVRIEGASHLADVFVYAESPRDLARQLGRLRKTWGDVQLRQLRQTRRLPRIAGQRRATPRAPRRQARRVSRRAQARSPDPPGPPSSPAPCSAPSAGGRP